MTYNGWMPTRITAFGETKSLSEWGRDPRCKVSTSTLRARIRNNPQADVEHAMTAGRLEYTQ